MATSPRQDAGANGETTVPDGFVGRPEAARMFGVTEETWRKWDNHGRVPIPRREIRLRNGALCILYPRADLERLLVQFRAQWAERERLTATLLTRAQAAELLDVCVFTFDDWVREGQVNLEPVWVPQRDRSPLKMWPREGLLAFRDELHQRMQPRPHPTLPGCYIVPLTHRMYDQREAVIDAESLPVVQGKNWHWEESSTKGLPGAVALATSRGSNTLLKRLIMGVAEGAKDLRVTHANGDPLDCRSCNLVVETYNEQAHRKRKPGILNGRKYTSQYKGVCWDEPRGKWKALIRRPDGKSFIGRFDDEEDAARAYDNAARELFGEYASLNFPEEGERAALPMAA